MAAVALALGAAALWGTGDFLGGLTTRRLNVLIVLFWSQLVGLLGLAVWIVLSGDERPGARLLWAAGAGIAGAVGLGCLYRGMAVGAMGIVAPISATSPIVPLLVSVVRGDSPAAVQWAGIGLALAGVVLVSREPGRGRPARRGGRRPGAPRGARLRPLHRRARRGGTGERAVGGCDGPLQLRPRARRCARVDAHGAPGASAAGAPRRRRRRLRHERERPPRARDDAWLARHRRRSERALPADDDSSRARDPPRATWRHSDGRRADRAHGCGPDRGRLTRHPLAAAIGPEATRQTLKRMLSTSPSSTT